MLEACQQGRKQVPLPVACKRVVITVTVTVIIFINDIHLADKDQMYMQKQCVQKLFIP